MIEKLKVVDKSQFHYLWNYHRLSDTYIKFNAHLTAYLLLSVDLILNFLMIIFSL